MKIIYNNNINEVDIITPGQKYLMSIDGTDKEKAEIIAQREVPKGTEYWIIEDNVVPKEDIFRKAWIITGGSLSVDFAKAQSIAHEIRRQKRSDEFVVFDRWVTVPSLKENAEIERQKIRDKYAIIQTNIDNAPDVDSIKSAINEIL